MEIIIKLDFMLRKHGYSQQEFSRLIEIRQASISEMCNNQTKRLPLDNLAKICKFFDCEITDILELKKEQSD